MNDTITAFAFPATAAAERSIKGHAANASTYALVAAVVVLTLAVAAFDWLIAQLDRAPEYVIRLKLAKVQALRQVVQMAIKAEQLRLAYAPRVVSALDRVFCLN